ncbi:hypothetical protein QCA50_012030 [Cerrena zonata]|uniref:Uncharacterized protein n=1 Tax=Cerrena zonata TaxID=2478898 RepID=A0AAW0FX78_9APHY
MKGFNTQIKGLANLGDELSEKFMKATSWFNKSKTKEEAKDIEVPKTTEELASEENALGDIIKNITKSSENQDPDDIIKKKSLNQVELIIHYQWQSVLMCHILKIKIQQVL